MFKRLTCFMSGGHQAEISRQGGTMFLVCDHCGWRSSGIELQQSRGAQARILAGNRQRVEVRMPLFNRPADS